MSDDVIQYTVQTIDETTTPTEKMAAAFSDLQKSMYETEGTASSAGSALEGVGEKTNAAGSAAQSTGISMSELNQGLEVVNKALGYAQQAYDATIGKSQAYAEQVRNLSNVSGESAENTSRFIQVLDDYQISAEDAMVATRALTKQGLAPTTDTLATLSEQYLSLSSVEDQNAFVTKNLGKAGLEWINVLKQGPDAIRANSAAVSANLILSQKDLQNAEKLRLAQDTLNDTLTGLSITMGTKLTPSFAAWVDLTNSVASGNFFTKWGDDIKRTSGWALIPGVELALSYSDSLNKITAATEKATNTPKEITASPEQIAASKAALDALSATYSTELQMAVSLQGALDGYNSSMDTLTQKQTDAKNAMQDAINQGWAPNSQHVDDLRQKLQDVNGQIEDTKNKYSEAMARMAYDSLVTKLSVDGLTDAEFNQAQQAGVALGVFTQATADKAVAMNSLTTALATGQITLSAFNQAVTDGSLKVSEANTAIITGYDTMTRTVITKAAESGDASTALAKTTTTAKDETTDALNKSASAWDGLKGNISGNVASINDQIDAYIAKLGQIPPVITTTLVATGAAGTSGGAGINTSPTGATAGGTVINYHIQNAIVGAGHELEILVS